jgi:hypothetical protein
MSQDGTLRSTTPTPGFISLPTNTTDTPKESSVHQINQYKFIKFLMILHFYNYILY